MRQIVKIESWTKVLDVGCGIGGSAFHMAKNYQVNVHGVDLSKNMLQIGQERAKEFGQDQVKFEFCDITKADFETESFDVIYSRDTILHIGEKEKLFTNFLKWLKPGGQLLITDYCHGEGELSQEFQDYVKQRCYSITTVSNYGKILEKVGFAEVKAEDNSNRFIEVLNTEMQHFENEKGDFIKEFSESDYNAIIGGWANKVKRCSSGYHRWGLFRATKPLVK